MIGYINRRGKFVNVENKPQWLNRRVAILRLRDVRVSVEACIGGYQVYHIPGSKQASIPYKLGNIPIIDFPKYQYPWK